MICLANTYLRFRVAKMAVFTALVCSLPALAQTLSAEKQQEVDALTKQIAANGSDYSLYAKRGFIYFQANSPAIADPEFKKALELNPSWQRGLLLRADCLSHLGKVQEAIDAVDKAEQLGPIPAQKIAWRGALFMKLNEYKSALANFTRAIELDPKDYLNWAGRATVNRELNGPSKSVESDL
ncbi:MAG: tetratricopeptide repeat protein [Cyanobacteria bacterium REEB67]|nr:tetratricopeptide repeat protein [Cyanobacteria bacterium REEB67]